MISKTLVKRRITPAETRRKLRSGMATPRRGTRLPYGGQEIWLSPGISLLSLDHELVCRHPELFRPADPRDEAVQARLEARSAGRAVADPRPAWRLGSDSKVVAQSPTPELRGGLSEVEVRLSAKARSRIVEEARASRDGLEVGGMLLGHPDRPWRSEIKISLAGGPGPRAKRRAGAFGSDHGHDIELAGEFTRSGSRLVQIGQWHSHPSGDDRASAADLGHWAALREVLDEKHRLTTRVVGLIVTPARGADEWSAWSRPCLTAYVVTPRPYGRTPLVQRARITT